MNNDRLIRVSKYLAKYPRHAPQKIGLTLGLGGWVPVDDLLAAAEKNGFSITYDEPVECVETNDKQRFAFDVSGELIRADLPGDDLSPLARFRSCRRRCRYSHVLDAGKTTSSR